MRTKKSNPQHLGGTHEKAGSGKRKSSYEILFEIWTFSKNWTLWSTGRRVGSKWSGTRVSIVTGRIITNINQLRFFCGYDGLWVFFCPGPRMSHIDRVFFSNFPPSLLKKSRTTQRRSFRTFAFSMSKPANSFSQFKNGQPFSVGDIELGALQFSPLDFSLTSTLSRQRLCHNSIIVSRLDPRGGSFFEPVD